MTMIPIWDGNYNVLVSAQTLHTHLTTNLCFLHIGLPNPNTLPTTVTSQLSGIADSKGMCVTYDFKLGREVTSLYILLTGYLFSPPPTLYLYLE